MRIGRINKRLFKHINKVGFRQNGNHFAFLYGRVEKGDKPRLSVVVPKSVAKQAVLRNKIKRRVRSIAAIFISNSRFQTYLIIFVKKGVAEMPFSIIQNELFAMKEKLTNHFSL